MRNRGYNISGHVFLLTCGQTMIITLQHAAYIYTGNISGHALGRTSSIAYFVDVKTISADISLGESLAFSQCHVSVM